MPATFFLPVCPDLVAGTFSFGTNLSGLLEDLDGVDVNQAAVHDATHSGCRISWASPFERRMTNGSNGSRRMNSRMVSMVIVDGSLEVNFCALSCLGGGC